MIAACAASRGWRKDGEAANEASREYVIVNSAGFEACRGERVNPRRCEQIRSILSPI